MRLSPRRKLTRVCLIAFLASGLAFAQQSMTVDRLMTFIRSAVEQKNPDKAVAATVATVRLTERFTLADLKELQDLGIGEKTLTALAALVTQSAKLNPPAPKAAATAKTAGPPPPSDATMRKVLQETREWAVGYVNSLPNFICWEVTDRSVAPRYQPGTEASWAHSDRIDEKLTFFDHKENYELFQHNDTAVVNKSADSLGGARSTGEWASLLAEIFEPRTQTDFRWSAWKMVRGKLAHEFLYRIERQYSQQTISHGDREKIIAGFHGSVFVEEATNTVLRITVTPEIPPDFAVQDVDQIVDYEYQDIGGQKFLLPLKSQVTMRDGRLGTRNDIQWRGYKKYSADASISFDTADLPPGK